MIFLSPSPSSFRASVPLFYSLSAVSFSSPNDSLFYLSTHRRKNTGKKSKDNTHSLRNPTTHLATQRPTPPRPSPPLLFLLFFPYPPPLSLFPPFPSQFSDPLAYPSLYPSSPAPFPLTLIFPSPSPFLCPSPSPFLCPFLPLPLPLTFALPLPSLYPFNPTTHRTTKSSSLFSYPFLYPIPCP